MFGCVEAAAAPRRLHDVTNRGGCALRRVPVPAGCSGPARRGTERGGRGAQGAGSARGCSRVGVGMRGGGEARPGVNWVCKWV